LTAWILHIVYSVYTAKKAETKARFCVLCVMRMDFQFCFQLCNEIGISNSIWKV